MDQKDKNQQKSAKYSENSGQTQKQQQKIQQNFYTDPNSPYAKSSQRLKHFLQKYNQDSTLNVDKMNLGELGYELKPTINNFCSRFFAVGEKYYLCKQCGIIQTQGLNICLCADCFDPTKHVDHTTIQTTSSNDLAYCDCGRVNSVRKQCFCQKHATFNRQFQCQIKQEQNGLIDCAIYLNNHKVLIQKICEYLCKLNQGSIYYNRLTYQVFVINSQNMFQGDQTPFNIISCYYIVLSCYTNTNKLVVHLTGDLVTRKLFIKFVIRILQNLGEIGSNLIQKFLTQNFFNQLFDSTAVLKLLQQGYTNYIFEIVLSKGGLSQEYHKAVQLYMTNKINSTKSLQQIFTIKTQMVKGQTSLKLLLKIIQLYPSNQAIHAKILQENGAVQKYTYNMLPQEIKTANVVILKFAAMVSVHSSDKMLNIRKYLKASISTVELDRILRWMLFTVKNILNRESSLSQYLCVSIFFLLAKGSLFQKQFISKFWNSLFQSTQIQKQKQIDKTKGVLPITQIHLFSDLFTKFSIILINTEIYRILQKKKSFIAFTKQQLNQTQQQEMKNWLKGFFYARKVIKKQVIIQMKLGGIFDFKDASKTLNQVCQYDAVNDLFYFVSPQKFQDITHKFPFVISKQNYNIIYSIQIHFGMEQNLIENSIPKILLQQTLSYENIIPLIDAQWERYLKSTKKNDGKYMYGYLYLFVLVTYDILTHGKNKDLRQRLLILRSDEQLLKNYSNKQQEIKLIKRLLNMQKKQQTPKKQQKIGQQRVQKVEKQQQKVLQEKIEAKVQQLNNAATEKMSENKNVSPIKSPAKQKMQQKSQKIRQQFNWTQDCAICKQKQKGNDILAYMGLINKNSTGCSAIYGKNSLTNTTLMTCFHKIHINCFMNMKKSQIFAYQCPICNTIRNCILPVRYKLQNERLNKICANSIVLAVLAIYAIYDAEDLFMLAFKHLVEQSGLKAILQQKNQTKFKQQWETINMYMKVLAIDIYKYSNQKKQKVHARHIEEFIQQIKNCQNNQCRLIQLLFAQAYQQIIINKTGLNNTQLANQIRNLIPQNQFNVVKTQLQKITLNALVLNPMTEEQKARVKKSIGFQLFELPKTAQKMAQIYLNRKCENGDNEQGACICLICRKIVCKKCRPKHFSEYHNNITVCFSLQALRVQFSRMDCPTNYQIYFNEYKMSIEEGVKHKMSDTEYVLDEAKYNKIIKTYLYI